MTNDLQEIKAAHDALPSPSATATARAKDLLAAEVEAGPRKSPVGRRLLLRAGTVGLAAAITAVAFVIGTDNAAPAGAAELLRQAATVAGQEQQPRHGQFVYVKRLDENWISAFSESEGRSEYTQKVDREAWIPADDPGNGLVRSAYGDRQVHTGQVPSMMPTPGTIDYVTGRCAAQELPTAGAERLPTDPDRLLARIRADAETSVRGEPLMAGAAPPSEEEIGRRVERTVADRLVTLARNSFPGPGLRETVLNALSRMPAATMRTDLTDPAGRQGVGASIRYQGPDGWETTELIFEEDTYRFLGWRHLSRHPDSGAEVLRDASAILEVKVVDTMPGIPAGAPEPRPC